MPVLFHYIYKCVLMYLKNFSIREPSLQLLITCASNIFTSTKIMCTVLSEEDLNDKSSDFVNEHGRNSLSFNKLCPIMPKVIPSKGQHIGRLNQ